MRDTIRNTPFKAAATIAAALAMLGGVAANAYPLKPVGPGAYRSGKPEVTRAAPPRSAAQEVRSGELPAIDADDPMAPARRGMLECGEPDERAKTCAWMAGYEDIGAGSWEATVLVPIVNHAGYVLRFRAPMKVVGGRACSIVNKSDVQRGQIFNRGKRMKRKLEKRALKTLYRVDGGSFGALDCTEQVMKEDGRTTYLSTSDGVVLDDDLGETKWVARSEGYRLRH